MSIDRVAVLGINRLSASIALGLKSQPEPPRIVGFDPLRAEARRARSMGALDDVARAMEKACRDADLVIVSLPLAAIREAFAAIAPHLKPGCLVTDTAHLKSPVWKWAKESLPDGVSFVGGHIVLNPAVVGPSLPSDLSAAAADLLRAALYCLVPLPGTSEAVIDTFSRLASTLGAVPFFIDVTEHDGIQAGVSSLPDLLMIALLQATVSGPSAADMRRFAGEGLVSMTDIAAEEIHERVLEMFLNRGSVILQLESLVRVLLRMRDMLMIEDRDAFESLFAAAVEGRARWLEERERGLWIRERLPDMSRVPSSGKQFQRLFFTEPPDSIRESR